MTTVFKGGVISSVSSLFSSDQFSCRLILTLHCSSTPYALSIYEEAKITEVEMEGRDYEERCRIVESDIEVNTDRAVARSSDGKQEEEWETEGGGGGEW